MFWKSCRESGDCLYFREMLKSIIFCSTSFKFHHLSNFKICKKKIFFIRCAKSNFAHQFACAKLEEFQKYEASLISLSIIVLDCNCNSRPLMIDLANKKVSSEQCKMWIVWTLSETCQKKKKLLHNPFSRFGNIELQKNFFAKFSRKRNDVPFWGYVYYSLSIECRVRHVDKSLYFLYSPFCDGIFRVYEVDVVNLPGAPLFCWKKFFHDFFSLITTRVRHVNKWSKL